MNASIGRIGGAALLFLALSILSCKDDVATPPQPDPDDNALPGVAYMGHGYNVFGEYARAEHVKSPLFAFAAYSTVTVKGKSWNVPTAMEYTAVNTSDFKGIYGMNSHEYRNEMSVRASLSGTYSFFSMSVTNNYNEKQYRSNYQAFCTIRNVIKKWKLTLPYTDLAALKALLRDDARSDLATLQPAALFGKYGTHVITELMIGARADYNTSVTKTVETRSIRNNFEMCAEASFKKKSGSGSFSMVTEQQLASFESNSFQNLKVSGGRSEYGSYIFQEGQYGKWIESIDNIENLTISDFTENSLLPIWELCADDARKNQLRSAFDSYATQFDLPALVDEAIDGLYFEVSGNPIVTPQEGWTLLNVDLNRDASGKYIFLCCKHGLDDAEAITDIAFIINNQATPPGYIKIGQDLNEGTKKHDASVYLCYKKGITSNPIRRIDILVGQNSTPQPGYTFAENFSSGVKQDLNAGAGGNFIWLTYSREFPDPWE